MTLKLLTFMFGCCLLAGCQPQVSEDNGPPEEPLPVIPEADRKATAVGNNAFALDLYKKLTEKETGNIVVSPYSVRTALAMTYAGARGQTADEMRKVAHFNLPDNQLHAAINGSARAMTPRGRDAAYRLNVANALWGQTGMPFNPEFLELTRREYGGGFRELDFASDPESARRVINGWVSEKTEKRIPELLLPPDIHRRVVLVLTNAIYFKGKWKQRFLTERTRDADFEMTPGERMTTKMMNIRNEDFNCYEGPEAKAVELPYQGDRLSMVLILPTKRHGLAELERSLTAEKLGTILAGMHEEQVVLSLPRFKSDTRFSLKEQLAALGMPTAFRDGEADFTGMTTSAGLHIGAVIHQAEIEVNEEGTVASAATAVAMQILSEPQTFVFKADEPFLYLIRDRVSGKIVFMGRCAKP